jgi:hypothetical protein
VGIIQPLLNVNNKGISFIIHTRSGASPRPDSQLMRSSTRFMITTASSTRRTESRDSSH